MTGDDVLAVLIGGGVAVALLLRRTNGPPSPPPPEEADDADEQPSRPRGCSRARDRPAARPGETEREEGRERPPVPGRTRRPRALDPEEEVLVRLVALRSFAPSTDLEAEYAAGAGDGDAILYLTEALRAVLTPPGGRARATDEKLRTVLARYEALLRDFSERDRWRYFRRECELAFGKAAAPDARRS